MGISSILVHLSHKFESTDFSSSPGFLQLDDHNLRWNYLAWLYFDSDFIDDIEFHVLSFSYTDKINVLNMAMATCCEMWHLILVKGKVIGRQCNRQSTWEWISNEVSKWIPGYINYSTLSSSKIDIIESSVFNFAGRTALTKISLDLLAFAWNRFSSCFMYHPAWSRAVGWRKCQDLCLCPFFMRYKP